MKLYNTIKFAISAEVRMATLTEAERVDLLRRLMWKCVNDYETEFRTHIARTRKLMQDHGAEATMEILMAKPGFTSAFARCNDADRLELSFEYTLVTHSEVWPLFEKSMVDRVRFLMRPIVKNRRVER